MKHIFIINQFAIGKKDDIESRIIAACEKLKLKYIIEKNSDEISTEDIIEKYKKGKNIINATGGDGIINRTLNMIVGTNNILGFIPYGTGNDLYRSALVQFKDGINDCDIAKINDKYFINVACFGIDAEVANNKKVMKSKIIPKKWKYKASLINTFIDYECRDFRVLINGQDIEDTYTTIAICNGMYYGGGFRIAPFSKLNDNALDVYLAKKLCKINILKLIIGMKEGKHEYTKYVRKHKAKELIIESKVEINANIDGEILRAKRFKVKLEDTPMKIYFNKKLIDEIINVKKMR